MQLFPNGIKAILAKLEEAYGPEASDIFAKVLDRFFLLKRYNGNLMDYCVAFTMRYDAANEQAGLEIGVVGLTHLFLGGAGLARRFIDDILLKVKKIVHRFFR